MLLAWGIGGVIVCFLLTGDPICAALGFFIGIAIRKWIFRNLWM